MSEDAKYKALYEKYLEYENQAHERNQRKIKNGLKVNILLPMVFLIISFITDSSKLIFLILWIVSLFGIAFYLVYVEYTDYRMQGLLRSLNESEEPDALIGGRASRLEETVSDRMDRMDEKIEETRKNVSSTISGMRKTNKKDKEDGDE